MNHRKSGRKFGRTSSHRKAMFRNMCCSFIEHELIRTTLPKAKELRRYMEPLITLAKKDTPHNRQIAFSRLRSKSAVKKLFVRICATESPVQQRPGGYLRILKHGFRAGDTAPMAFVCLSDDLDSASED